MLDNIYCHFTIKLSDKSKERAVPSTKISRMFNYGGI